MNLDYRTAHLFVANFSSKNSKAFWDGWNIVIATPNRAAWFKRDGRFIDGCWHRTITISPNKYGKWRIPARYAI